MKPQKPLGGGGLRNRVVSAAQPLHQAMTHAGLIPTVMKTSIKRSKRSKDKKSAECIPEFVPDPKSSTMPGVCTRMMRNPDYKGPRVSVAAMKKRAESAGLEVNEAPLTKDQEDCSASASFTRLVEVVGMTHYHPRKKHSVALFVMGVDVETIAAELEYIAWAMRNGEVQWQGRAQGRLLTRVAYGQ